METEKTSLGSRILIGFFNGVVALVVIALIQTVLFFKGSNKGGTETGV